MEQPSPATPAAAAPSLTFVLCVEAGSLEQQTVRCVDSLRRFGGRFAGCSVVAVRPRGGAKLLPAVVRRLGELGVRLVDRPGANPYPFFGFYNKAAAFDLLDREGMLTTDLVAFADSDTLVLRPPDRLDLPAGVDFAAVPSQSSGATTGPGHPNHAYWEHVARQAGLDVNTFPRVQSYREGDDMHLYWNAGVFVFRRATGFIPAYVQENRRVLTCGVRSPVAGLFYTDQVALPLIVRRLGLRFEHLPLGYNHSVHVPVARAHRSLQVERDEAFWRSVKVVHYHLSMGTDGVGELVEVVRQVNPAAADWLAGLGRLPPRRGPWYTLAKRVRERARSRRLVAFVNRCTVAGGADAAAVVSLRG